jgi:hypothetical protein
MPLRGTRRYMKIKTTEHTENSREHREYNSCHCEALQHAAEQSEAIPMAAWTGGIGIATHSFGMLAMTVLNAVSPIPRYSVSPFHHGIRNKVWDLLT